MKYSRKALGGIAIVLAMAFSAVFAADSLPPQVTKGWQHLAFETGPSLKGPDTGRRINQLGRDGWELVGVTQISSNGSTEKLVYYFKKPLE